MVAISSKNSEEVRSLSARVIREGWSLKNGKLRREGMTMSKNVEINKKYEKYYSLAALHYSLLSTKQTLNREKEGSKA